MEATEHSFASTKLYHPSGAQVTFSWPMPVTEGRISQFIAQDVMNNVTLLLSAGFSANVPGLEPGQEKEPVGAVSRRAKADGTPTLDLFAPTDALKHKIITIYIDSDEDRSAFETATGLKIESLPINDAEQAVTRESRNADRLIIPCKRPAVAILEPNPRYDPNEQDTSKKKPKRLFVGWETTPAARPTPPSAALSTLATVPQALSASTAPTQQAVAASVDGFAAKFTATTSATPDQLWEKVRDYYDARPHYDASISKHAADLVGKTLEEQEAFIKTLHWNYDRVRCNDFSVWGRTHHEMSTQDILDALKNANGHSIAKMRDWDGGDWFHGLAALLAWAAGYDEQNIETSVDMKKGYPDAVIPLAGDYCHKYQQDHDASGRKAIAAELRNQMITIVTIKHDLTKRGHEKWLAWADVEGEPQQLLINMFQEDINAIKSAGYALAFDRAGNVEVCAIPVTAYHNGNTGWRIESVLKREMLA